MRLKNVEAGMKQFNRILRLISSAASILSTVIHMTKGFFSAQNLFMNSRVFQFFSLILALIMPTGGDTHLPASDLSSEQNPLPTPKLSLILATEPLILKKSRKKRC